MRGFEIGGAKERLWQFKVEIGIVDTVRRRRILGSRSGQGGIAPGTRGEGGNQPGTTLPANFSIL